MENKIPGDAQRPESETSVNAEQAAGVASAMQAGFPIRTVAKARGIALTVLMVLAILFSLQWAQKFLIPLVLGIFIAYTLNPVVGWLERIHVPRVLGTALIMIAICGGAIAAGNTLYKEFNAILAGMPEAAKKISRAVTRAQNGPNPVEQMEKAAQEIEKAAGVGQPTKKSAQPPAPAIKVREWLIEGSMNALSLVTQLTMVLFLVFFLLLAGDTFKRKLVRITGPKISDKKTAVQIMDEIHDSVQSYMFMLLVTNVLLAAMMWVALRWIGLENAGAWAAAAGLLHIIPYFGPILITITSGISAFLQFESIPMALLVAGCSLGIATFVGTFVTTWMTGKLVKMNPTAVFVGLLFWGWLWGMWGMLLGIPIIVIVKVVSEHVESMNPIAELLGE
ncbi:AI-2E family transporter [Oxalobacteraceae bacterium R-40]|uniref:AI-2E family transporter n=1 Tax=Keguizhuia sedimenti TaxID=3064264 RepID=A0ABU1BNJ2_9BURK|nr:AI-2E family transporter [Oxalobacteraceae bacterium R-40]